MTTSTKKQEPQQQQQQHLYGEYINPTIEQYSSKQENPLVLMAQACNNIGKDLTTTTTTTASTTTTISSSSSSSPSTTLSLTSKQRKSNSSPEVKKSLKRTAPSTPSPPAKRMAHAPPPLGAPSSSVNPHSFYLPPSPLMFDSLLLHHLSKSFTSSAFFAAPAFSPSSSSAFSPSSQRSPYFMDSILAPLKPSPQLPAFVCNWMESNSADGFCGKRFANHFSLLEHLCTAHTSLSSMKSAYPSFAPFYAPTSVGKL